MYVLMLKVLNEREGVKVRLFISIVTYIPLLQYTNSMYEYVLFVEDGTINSIRVSENIKEY